MHRHGAPGTSESTSRRLAAVGGGAFWETRRVDARVSTRSTRLVRRLDPRRRSRRAAHPPRGAPGPGRATGRPGRTWAPPTLVAAPGGRAASTQPWRHQVEAAEAAHAGDTWSCRPAPPRASRWPTCCPALTEIQESARPHGPARRHGALPLPHQGARPGPARRACSALGLPGLAATTHDGDTSREQRDWARDHAEYVLTNPDMLHHSLLPGHARWARFFGLLRYVVIDECHHYRGVFGAHVAQIAAPAAAGVRVVRRLARRSCWPRPRSPSRRSSAGAAHRPRRSRAVTEDALGARRRSSLALWEPPFTSLRRGERRAGPAVRDRGGRRPARPTSSSRACARWRSSGPGAAPSRSR